MTDQWKLDASRANRKWLLARKEKYPIQIELPRDGGPNIREATALPIKLIFAPILADGTIVWGFEDTASAALFRKTFNIEEG